MRNTNERSANFLGILLNSSRNVTLKFASRALKLINSKIFGFVIKALASATRCFWPQIILMVVVSKAPVIAQPRAIDLRFSRSFAKTLIKTINNIFIYSHMRKKGII